jgi:ABC-type glycerol-3-phosphate transport system substrate-binding protein
MQKSVFLLGVAATLAACGQSTDDGANQAAATAEAAKKKIPYCFFKDEEMKGWSAKRGKDGNITVKGKVYREDSRYQAILAPAAVSGAHAEVSPDLQQNGTGFGAPDNWWDVSQTISNSAAVDTVDVTCGGKVIANFKIEPKG